MKSDHIYVYKMADEFKINFIFTIGFICKQVDSY